MSNASAKILKLTQVAILIAIMIVLQLFVTIPIGIFNLSLVLIPIVIGGELFGPKTSTLLGFIFGVVVLIVSATGRDPGGFMMWQANWWLTALVCLIKGAAAGLACGYISAAFKNSRYRILGTVLAALSAPIVNTGLFLLALTTLYPTTLSAWMAGAGATNALVYIMSGIVLCNFVPELLVNAVFSPAIVRIVDAIKKAG